MASETAYELLVSPDGTSWAARENLHDVLRRELLGPADGDTEVLDAAPDTRYLIGRIAPVRLTPTREVPEAYDDADRAERDDRDPSTLDLGDDLAATASRCPSPMSTRPPPTATRTPSRTSRCGGG